MVSLALGAGEVVSLTPARGQQVSVELSSWSNFDIFKPGGGNVIR